MKTHTVASSSSSSAAPHSYHHEAIHRLLHLGFLIHWSVCSTTSSSSNASAGLLQERDHKVGSLAFAPAPGPTELLRSADSPDVVGLNDSSASLSSPPSSGTVRGPYDCPLCQQADLPSRGARRVGKGARSTVKGGASKYAKGMRSHAQRSAANRSVRGTRGSVNVLDDEMRDWAAEQQREMEEAMGEYAQSFGSVWKSKAAENVAKYFPELCVRYAAELGLRSAAESYRMIAVLPEVTTARSLNPHPGALSSESLPSGSPCSSGAPFSGSIKDPSRGVTLPAVKKQQCSATTPAAAVQPNNTTTATTTTMSSNTLTPVCSCCSSPTVTPVPVVFFSFPAWLHTEEVTPAEKQRLLSYRRFPSSSPSVSTRTSSLTPNTKMPHPTSEDPVIYDESVFLLFQRQKELTPSMRNPPHLTDHLGEVCCCDVYLVIAPASLLTGQPAAMWVWGVCDSAKHLHSGASSNPTTSVASAHRTSHRPNNNMKFEKRQKSPSPATATAPTSSTVFTVTSREEGEDHEGATTPKNMKEASRSGTPTYYYDGNDENSSGRSSDLNRSTIDFDGLIITNPRLSQANRGHANRSGGANVKPTPGNLKPVGSSTLQLPAPDAHRKYSAVSPDITHINSPPSPRSTALPHHHMELFCIADSLDSYFRLGAAFGWIYGWQLCYSSVGPPVASVPWLRLFNASAYHAARALSQSVEHTLNDTHSTTTSLTVRSC